MEKEEVKHSLFVDEMIHTNKTLKMPPKITTEELKSLLKKVREESEKAGLKLKVQKTKIMASGPITSWQIDEETVERVSDFILGTPKSLQMVTVAMT